MAEERRESPWVPERLAAAFNCINLQFTQTPGSSQASRTLVTAQHGYTGSRYTEHRYTESGVVQNVKLLAGEETIGLAAAQHY